MSEPDSRARAAGRSAYRTLLDIVLTGTVVILPVIVTLYVLSAALDIVKSVIGPLVKLLAWSGLLLEFKQFAAGNVLITIGIYSDVNHRRYAGR